MIVRRLDNYTAVQDVSYAGAKTIMHTILILHLKATTFDTNLNKSMKASLFMLFVCVALFSCSKSNRQDHDHRADEVTGGDTNEVLYNEVMRIHDDAMEKMDEIYRMRQLLKAKLDSASTAEKADIQTAYNKLDSADKGMMEWMHRFQPDSLEGEAYREYMESELEKIKMVNEDILDALQRAKEKTQ